MTRVTVKENNKINISLKEARVVFKENPDGTTYVVQADWNETDSTKPGYIQNKPDFSSILDEVRENLSSSVVVRDENGIVEGNIYLSAEPTENNQATTKLYVDAKKQEILNSVGETYVKKTEIGDVFNNMTIYGGNSNE